MLTMWDSLLMPPTGRQIDQVDSVERVSRSLPSHVEQWLAVEWSHVLPVEVVEPV
jgi:hypothetical protein